ncbi:MAG: hypothetical protein Q4B28_08665, partial [bacterium]|nr:hypothetical protein [bacterium]
QLRRLRLYLLTQQKMKKLLHSLALLLLAGTLAVVLLPLGILWTIGEIIVRIFTGVGKNSARQKSLGYLASIIRSIAVGIDQIGNSVCRDMLNRLLIATG